MTRRQAQAELRESRAAYRAQVKAARAEYERQVRRARAGLELAKSRLAPSLDPEMSAFLEDCRAQASTMHATYDAMSPAERQAHDDERARLARAGR